MAEKPIQVLIIEDSPVVRSVVKNMLVKGHHTPFEVHGSENLTKGLAWLNESSVDVIILDLSLPESTGVETIGKVRAADSDVPIVVFTASDDDRLAMAAMHHGANDYLVKTEVKQGSLLVRTLLYSIERRRSKAALNQYAVEMERLAQQRAQKIVHQDRLATLGTMSTGIIHEIRSPLAFITDNARNLTNSWVHVEACLKECQKNSFGDAEEIEFLLDEAPEMLSDIVLGVKKITEISKGLKKFARKDDEEIKSVFIEECLDSALMLSHNLLKYGITVEKDLEEQAAPVLLRPQQITQVLINLITNAAHAMDNKGTLTLSTCFKNDLATIILDDTGPGIPIEKMETIWEPFFTTKDEDAGTGLGLSICQEIIGRHDGQISVMNRPQGGARFTIELPAVPVSGKAPLG